MRRFTSGVAKATLAALAALFMVACTDQADEQTLAAAGKDDGDSAAVAVAEYQAPDEYWKVVQAYLVLDTAWHDGDLDQGPHPDITLAVAAAKLIVADADHPRRLAAAEFLAEHPRGMLESADDDMALGRQTLQALIGTDWSAVEGYVADSQRWEAASEEIDEADLSADERKSRRKALGKRPAVHRAVAAATVIIGIADHARRQEAAEFLVLESGRGSQVLAGARILFADFPAFADWPKALRAIDRSQFGANEPIEQFFAEVAAEAGDAAVRATAKYFLAGRLTQAANKFGAVPAERDAQRQRALELAVGMSEGVAEQEFVSPREYTDDGTPVTGTFAQAEADLIYRIEHVTAGGTLAEATGKRLDGTEETLHAFADKVVLIDFWATWCGPCVGALPTLRELHADMPADRFVLLSISVDDELDTVKDFQADESMPWENWHVGEKSKLGIAWGIRAYPTYILVDDQGTILARTNALGDSLLALIEDTVGHDTTS